MYNIATGYITLKRVDFTSENEETWSSAKGATHELCYFLCASPSAPKVLAYTSPSPSYYIIEKQLIHGVIHVCKALKWFASSTCILLHQGLSECIDYTL